MNIINVSLAALTAALLTFGLAAPSLAQQQRTEAPAAGTGSTGPVVVLDVQRVLRDSAAGKAAGQQLSEMRTRYQAEIAKSEEQLRSEQEELGRQRSLLSPEAFDERRRGFEQKLQQTQRLVQERNSSLEASQRQVREEIGKVVIAVVSEMMKERGFSLVLDRAQIVASDTSIEITADVLKRLDSRLPTVKVAPMATKQ